MNKKSYILALDIGTSSLKVGLFNRNLQMLTTRRAEYSYRSFGMCFQIEPEMVWKAFLKVMEELRDYLNKVELVVQCVFSPALMALDEDGNALYPAIIHWDRRSVKQAKEALAKVGKEKFLHIAGNIPYPGGISVTSILWLKQKKKKVFEKAFKFGHMNTFFVKRLTNKWLMFDITTGGFALEWFRSQFCREMSQEEFYNSYLRKLLEKKGSCQVNFNPYLAGLGSTSKSFNAYRSLDGEKEASLGKLASRRETITYSAPARSVTTFYAHETRG